MGFMGFFKPNVEKLHKKKDVKGLIKALQYEPKDGLIDMDMIKLRAAMALGKIGDSKAVLPLVYALQDSCPVDRRIAAQSLGEIGDTRAITPLVELLKDSDSEVSAQALKSLLAIDPNYKKIAKEELTENTKIDSSQLRQWLKNLKGPNAPHGSEVSIVARKLEEDLNNENIWGRLLNALEMANTNGSAASIIACVDTAIAVSPQNTSFHIYKCDALVKLGRRVDAISCVNELAKFDSDAANNVRKSRSL